MATDVYALEPDLPEVRELPHGPGRVLQRDGSHAGKSRRRRIDHSGHELIHEVGDGLRRVGRQPIGQKLGQRRNHLNVDALLIEAADALLDVPIEALEYPELAAGNDHFRVGIIDRLHRRPVRLDNAPRPVGIAARNDMRVKIDYFHVYRSLSSVPRLVRRCREWIRQT